jgi:hypothetical protein
VTQVAGGLFFILAGAGVNSLGALLAQVPSSGGGELAPYVSGAGSITAVAGIVYIARLLATGRLVARDPSIEAEALKKLADSNAELAKEAHEREANYRDLLLQGLAPERRK